MKKRFIALLLTLAVCFSLGITAVAVDDPSLESAEISSMRRFQREKTKTISSTVGIYIDVTYTYNDSNNAITGVQKTVITKIPDGYTNVSCTVSAIEDDCAIISVTYKIVSTGRYESEALYVFA